MIKGKDLMLDGRCRLVCDMCEATTHEVSCINNTINVVCNNCGRILVAIDVKHSDVASGY